MAAVGAYFGQDVQSIVTRLLAEQLPDGGWNCDAPHRSTRSSFNTTICVLEALLAYEARIGAAEASRLGVRQARLLGQEYLLKRRLFRRLSTGEPIDQDRKGGWQWKLFAFPAWWHYDILRALEYFRHAGVSYDHRMAEAIQLVRSKAHQRGQWPLEIRYPGVMPVEIDDGQGFPSRWNTLRALRVLIWFQE